MDWIWWLKCLTVGAAGGFIGGLLGVGGGIIMVPLLVYLMKLEILDAKAISLAIIIIVAVSGTAKHQSMGLLAGRWPMILAAGITAALCGVAGAALSTKVPRELLRQAFAVLMILTALNLLRPSRPAAPAPAVETSEPAPAR